MLLPPTTLKGPGDGKSDMSHRAKLLWERVWRAKTKLLAAQMDIAMARIAVRGETVCQGTNTLLCVRAKGCLGALIVR